MLTFEPESRARIEILLSRTGIAKQFHGDRLFFTPQSGRRTGNRFLVKELGFTLTNYTAGNGSFEPNLVVRYSAANGGSNHSESCPSIQACNYRVLLTTVDR